MASPSIDENRIWPSAPQVPENPMVSRTSQIDTGAPPRRSIRRSLVPAKNASERPSGDQNSDVAPSVPASGLAFSSATAPHPDPDGSAPLRAVKAICVPSGDTERPVFSKNFIERAVCRRRD